MGVKATTGEIIVGTMKGIWRTRSVRRKPEEDRWSVDNMSLVGGVPWRMSSNDENVDGAALQGGVVRPDGGQVMGDVDERDLRDVLRAVPPKAFATNREDYERHGTLPGAQVARPCSQGRLGRSIPMLAGGGWEQKWRTRRR